MKERKYDVLCCVVLCGLEAVWILVYSEPPRLALSEIFVFELWGGPAGLLYWEFLTRPNILFWLKPYYS